MNFGIDHALNIERTLTVNIGRNLIEISVGFHEGIPRKIPGGIPSRSQFLGEPRKSRKESQEETRKKSREKFPEKSQERSEDASDKSMEGFRNKYMEESQRKSMDDSGEEFAEESRSQALEKFERNV